MAAHLSDRAFDVGAIRLDRHQVTFVSMDNVRQYGDIETICPLDRLEQISRVGGADLTMVPYFTPELQRNVYSLPLLGKAARNINFISPDYFEIADMGHAMNKRMGTADVANRPLFYPYEVASLPFELALGSLCVDPRKRERYVPTAVDARRLRTAQAIKQETERHPEGVHIVYIAAPAHVRRIAHYVVHQEARLDRIRSELYRYVFPGLDSQLRIYEPDGENWRLAESHDV